MDPCIKFTESDIIVTIMIIIKVAKAHSKRVSEVGTCGDHKPIIDQSCGAVFVPDSSHRDLSASNFPGLIDTMDLRPTYARNTGQLKIAYTRLFFLRG